MSQPFLEKVNVFEARTNGYHNYRIPTLIMTKNKVLVAFAEGRKGEGRDWDPNDIVMKRSLDGGNNWEDMRVLVTNGRSTFSNLVAIVDRDGKTIHVLYCENYERCFYMKSEDDCQTFNGAVDITTTFDTFHPEYDWKVLATGPGHGIQLGSGRLIVPVWISLGLDKSRHRPSRISVIYSDDGGKMWGRSELVPDNEGINMSETCAEQLHDGTVYLNIRSESDANRRKYTFSKDGAGPWAETQYDEGLTEPICKASLIRYSLEGPDERNRILFCNPAGMEPAGINKKKMTRKRLKVRLSYDEAKTWPVSKLLEEGDAEYSDLAVGPDKTIYCFYGRDYLEKQNDCRYMTVAKFNLDWLTGGNEPR